MYLTVVVWVLDSVCLYVSLTFCSNFVGDIAGAQEGEEVGLFGMRPVVPATCSERRLLA